MMPYEPVARSSLWFVNAISEPADAVLPYSSRIIGASSRVAGATERVLRDELVELLVRLVQPVAIHLQRRHAVRREVLGDELRGHRHDVLDDAATVLMEQLVGIVARAGIAAIEIAGVVANVRRELRHHLRRQDLPRAGPRTRDGLDDERDRRVAEQEVAVALAPVHVRRRQLGTDDERAAGVAELDRLVSLDRRADGGRTAERHVEAVAVRADRVEHLDRERRILALQIGRAEHDEIDVLADAARLLERDLRGLDGVLRLDRDLRLRAIRNVRAHPLGIEDAGLVLDVAVLDSRRADDELGARVLERFARAGRDRVGVLGVVAADELVEGSDQLVVDEVGVRMPDAVAGDRGSCGGASHDVPLVSVRTLLVSAPPEFGHIGTICTRRTALATVCPGRHATAVTRPAIGASSANTSFIDSMTTTISPAAIC